MKTSSPHYSYFFNTVSPLDLLYSCNETVLQSKSNYNVNIEPQENKDEPMEESDENKISSCEDLPQVNTQQSQLVPSVHDQMREQIVRLNDKKRQRSDEFLKAEEPQLKRNKTH